MVVHPLAFWVSKSDPTSLVVPPRSWAPERPPLIPSDRAAIAALPLPFSAVSACLKWIVERPAAGCSSSLSATPSAGRKRSAALAGLGEAPAIRDDSDPAAGSAVPSIGAAVHWDAPEGVHEGLLAAQRHPEGLHGALVFAQVALELKHHKLLWALFKDPRHPGERWKPTAVASVVRCEISPPSLAAGGRAAGGRAAAPLSVQLIQTAQMSGERPHEIVAQFDLTCCMAAFDGESIYVSSAAIPTGADESCWPLAQGGPGGPRVAVNRAVLEGRSYWHLLRTARRVRKYTARGLGITEEGAAWLAEEIRARVRDPAALRQACKNAKLQEAVAMLRAGTTPLPPESPDWLPVGVPEEKQTAFRAAVDPCVAVFCSQRAVVARAAATAFGVSRSFAAALKSLPREISLLIAGAICGSSRETLTEAFEAAREEWASCDTTFHATLVAQAKAAGTPGDPLEDYF